METPEQLLRALEAFRNDSLFGAGEDDVFLELLRQRILIPLQQHVSPFASLTSDGVPAADPSGNQFRPADGRNSMPQAVRLAMEMRDVFMKFAVVVALRRFAEREGSTSRLSDIVAMLVRDVGDNQRPCVMQPARLASNPAAGSAVTDYALSDHADEFFNNYLQPRFAKVDNAYGTRLIDLTGGAYVRSDVSSIERWSRVWTAGVAVETLDWIRHRGCRPRSKTHDPSAEELALALWRIRTNFHPGKDPLLPSNHREHPRLTVSLQLGTLLAQMLEYDERRWDGANIDARLVRIRIQALGSGWQFGDPYYRGRNIGQVRFAVLAECLPPVLPVM
jgi:hypothetical protein